MSGPSTYEPKSGFTRWLDKRLPIMRLTHDSFVAFPTPRNLNYWWTFGAMLTLCLVVQIVTGIVLAMHYVPHISMAFSSVQRIQRDVPFGWLIQNIHAVGASMFFLAVYVHMFGPHAPGLRPDVPPEMLTLVTGSLLAHGSVVSSSGRAVNCLYIAARAVLAMPRVDSAGISDWLGRRSDFQACAGGNERLFAR